MTINVDVPALGENVTEAQITRWLKQVGDTIEADAQDLVAGSTFHEGSAEDSHRQAEFVGVEGARAKATLSAAAAMALWPRPCPMHPVAGSADATHAVGRSATPFSPVNRPPSSRAAVIDAEVSRSSKASSGLALIRCEGSRTQSRFSSNAQLMGSLISVMSAVLSCLVPDRRSGRGSRTRRPRARRCARAAR